MAFRLLNCLTTRPKLMKRILLILTMASLVFATQAQEAKGSFGINIKAYSPKAQFNRNVNKIPIGVSLNYLRSYEHCKVRQEIGLLHRA